MQHRGGIRLVPNYCYDVSVWLYRWVFGRYRWAFVLDGAVWVQPPQIELETLVSS